MRKLPGLEAQESGKRMITEDLEKWQRTKLLQKGCEFNYETTAKPKFGNFEENSYETAQWNMIQNEKWENFAELKIFCKDCTIATEWIGLPCPLTNEKIGFAAVVCNFRTSQASVSKVKSRWLRNRTMKPNLRQVVETLRTILKLAETVSQLYHHIPPDLVLISSVLVLGSSSGQIA
jgi:hypothetical protein